MGANLAPAGVVRGANFRDLCLEGGKVALELGEYGAGLVEGLVDVRELLGGCEFGPARVRLPSPSSSAVSGRRRER